MQLGMSTDSRVSTLGARGSQSTGRRKPRPRGCILAQPALASPLALSLSLSLSLPLSILRSRHTTAHCPASTVCKRNFRKITLLYPRGARALFSSYRTKRATGPDPAPKWTMAHFSFRFGSGPLQLSYRRPSSKHRSHVLSGARWLAEPRPRATAARLCASWCRRLCVSASLCLGAWRSGAVAARLVLRVLWP